MAGETVTLLLMLSPLVLVLVGLLFALLIDPYISRRQRSIFIAVIVLIFSLVAQNLADYLLDRNGALPLARTVAGISSCAPSAISTCSSTAGPSLSRPRNAESCSRISSISAGRE